MSSTSTQLSAALLHTPAPAIFGDGVISAAIGPGIVKFYIVRADPALDGTSDVSTSVAAQIVMPIEGFISTVLFFQERLEYYLNWAH